MHESRLERQAADFLHHERFPLSRKLPGPPQSLSSSTSALPTACCHPEGHAFCGLKDLNELCFLAAQTEILQREKTALQDDN